MCIALLEEKRVNKVDKDVVQLLCCGCALFMCCGCALFILEHTVDISHLVHAATNNSLNLTSLTSLAQSYHIDQCFPNY